MTRVLLVDDPRLLAEVEGSALERADLEIIVPPAGADIEQFVADLRPAALVVGEGDACPYALDLCRRLRANPLTSGVGIIYIGIGLNRERSREAGADVFVPRPFTRFELREAFLRVLRLKDRIALRRRVDLPVELSVGRDHVHGACRDLSLSGAFLVADCAAAAGERGRMLFEAGGRRFELGVEVVRRGHLRPGEAGVGVSFVGLEQAIGVQLSRFVRTVGPTG